MQSFLPSSSFLTVTPLPPTVKSSEINKWFQPDLGACLCVTLVVLLCSIKWLQVLFSAEVSLLTCYISLSSPKKALKELSQKQGVTLSRLPFQHGSLLYATLCGKRHKVPLIFLVTCHSKVSVCKGSILGVRQENTEPSVVLDTAL